jgi:hypothetical protein
VPRLFFKELWTIFCLRDAGNARPAPIFQRIASPVARCGARAISHRAMGELLNNPRQYGEIKTSER